MPTRKESVYHILRIPPQCRKDSFEHPQAVFSTPAGRDVFLATTAEGEHRPALQLPARRPLKVERVLRACARARAAWAEKRGPSKTRRRRGGAKRAESAQAQDVPHVRKHSDAI